MNALMPLIAVGATASGPAPDETTLKHAGSKIGARLRPVMMSQRLLLFLMAVLGGWVPFADAAVVVTHPFEGITFIARTEANPRPVVMHVVLVDLAAPGVTLKLTPPGGGRDTTRQTTLNFLRQENAQIAVNVHFFVPYPSDETNANVVGFAVSQGKVYSPFEPQPVAPGMVDQSYAILPHAPALNIDQSNRVTVIHRDPMDPSNRQVLERVSLWTAFSGSAQIVSNGVKTIPDYSGSPSGLTRSKTYSATNSWYSLARARTAIGVMSDQKTLVLFTVDQAGGSGGMSVDEVADLLIKDYQVNDALNLDGGGSTTLAMQDPATKVGRLVNVPNDNPRGRSVGSNLAVFARSRAAGRP